MYDGRAVKPFQLAVVLLRVYAVTLLVHSISASMSVIPLFWSGPEDKMMEMPVRVWGMVNGVVILCILGLAALFLLRTEIVARFVCRGLPGGEAVSVGLRDLAVLGFSILGLYCVIDGAPGVVWTVLRWRSGYSHAFDRFFVAAAVETAIGLLLFVTPHGFVRIAQWVRRAGAPEPVSIPPTPPAGS